MYKVFYQNRRPDLLCHKIFEEKQMRCIIIYVKLYWCVHIVTLLAALKRARMTTRKLQAGEHRREQTVIFLLSVANFRTSAGSSENSGPPSLRRFFNRLAA